MGNDSTKKKYRLTGIYGRDGDGHMTTRMEIDPGVFLDVGGEPHEMTEEQADKVRRFGTLELVEDDEQPLALIDQPGVFGTSTSTATVPVSGSTPDVSSASPSELKRLAREANIEGRTGMDDDALRAALTDHYNRQEA